MWRGYTFIYILTFLVTESFMEKKNVDVDMNSKYS